MKKSLWGDEFDLPDNTEKVLKKIKEKKEVSVEKQIKSKNISLIDKIRLITDEVHRILGGYESNTKVIRDNSELSSYIDIAIKNGIIAVDTETNNSLDPITCKLMGLCIYTPGEKQVYVPVNHTDLEGNLLPNQIIESFIGEQLARLADTKIVMHNGKFDYQVLYCTCGQRLKIYWDTMIGSQLLNENEPAGLKYQYINKIDPSIEKYDIERLFKKEQYAIFDPELFALYAATDAWMTYKLYEYQLNEFNKYPRLFNLFKTIEMPVVEVVANMELNGCCIDVEYSERLSKKWHRKLDAANEIIQAEFDKYYPQVEKWRLSKEANLHLLSYKKKEKSTEKKTKAKGNVAKQADGVTLNGKTYLYLEDLPDELKFNLPDTISVNKTKSEQLEWPINPSSSLQFGIFLYDILKVGIVDKENPRGTGEDILKQLKLPLCDAILEQRSLETIISTFIDKLPKSLNPKDHKLHGSFNQLGREEKGVVTGRFSSSDPKCKLGPMLVIAW